jgi:YVTN family beta-propeller protein
VAASFDASRLTTIDTATLEVVATHDVESGTGIALHPVLPRLYSMRGFDAEVAVYDLATRAEIAMVAVGDGPVRGVATRDGTALYVVNEDANNVVRIDTASNTAVLRIAVGSNPHAVALLEDTAPPRWAALVIVGIVLIAVAVITRRRAGHAAA